jgi:hypothetical protein
LIVTAFGARGNCKNTFYVWCALNHV